MLSSVDLNNVSNSDIWLKAAERAVEEFDNNKLWEELIELTEYLPSINQKNKYDVGFFNKRTSKELVLLVYENALIIFPLDEFKWIKYATWYYKFHRLEDAITTYERALSILPHSLVIWNSYLDLLLETCFDTERILDNFERARSMISYHYLSSTFLDKYLNFLKTNKMVREHHLLIRRIIEIPQHEYLKYFEEFLSLIGEANLDTIKFIITKKELKSEYDTMWIDLIDPKKFHKLKIDLKKKFTDTFITTQYNTYKYYGFEKRIQSHHYIPGDLSRAQLLNWKAYIEYVENMNLKGVRKEKEISLNKNNICHIDLIYNRCLTVTASYQYFWIKYSNYYLNYNNFDAAEKILLKGTYLNPVKNLKLRLRLVDIYILTSKIEKAKAITEELLVLLPYNLQFQCKLIEIQHFLEPSNTDKLIINKLNEIGKLNDTAVQEQFDYLFIEMLKYSSISVSKLTNIFEMFKDKQSYFYKKATQQFDTYHKLKEVEAKEIPEGWKCEYF